MQTNESSISLLQDTEIESFRNFKSQIPNPKEYRFFGAWCLRFGA